MKNRTRWVFTGAVVVLAGIGVALAIAGANELSHTDATVEKPSLPVITVRMQQVVSSSKADDQTYTGTIRARYETDIAPRVGGKVIAREVEVGQHVRAGDVLFRLDPVDFELAVRTAEADLDGARAEVAQSKTEFDRLSRLRSNNALSQSEFDKGLSSRDIALARLARAEAGLTLAQHQLEYSKVAADADAVVMALAVEAGQVVAQGQMVARLALDGQREAIVSLPENQVAFAKIAAAKIGLWSTPGKFYDAKLREIAPMADPITRTYEARFTLLNPDSDIALGMTATVHLAAVGAESQFELPLSSLIRKEGKPAVWLVESDGSIRLIPVKVAEYRHESVVLSEGVKPGDTVVTAGVQKLDDGLKVRAWETAK